MKQVPQHILRKYTISCFVATFLLVACSNEQFDITANKYLNKIEAFCEYSKCNRMVIEQLVEIIGKDDEDGLETAFAGVVDENVTGFNTSDICNYIEGDVIEIHKQGSSIHKENNGLFSKEYTIDFYGSYILKTDKDNYRLFYHYCFANGDANEVGLRSLGVSIYGEYEDTGYMYYDIPGVYICNNENKEFILELKEKYAKYK